MDTTDAVMDLAKRRGFLFPSFEVYGAMAGFYDYGPLGAAMKRRFEELWRRTFMDCAVPMAEVFCPRVTMHAVLKASGHVDEFTDLVVRCSNGHPSRADHLVTAAGYQGNADALEADDVDKQIQQLGAQCPMCSDTTFTPAAPMNLMFNTEIGPGSGRIGYLRPETAQGIFTDFPHLLRHFRGKLPFGGIQIGGSNRNEISPRQGMVRLREFNMMEAEVFFLDTAQPLAALHAEARCGVEATFVDGEGHEHRMSFRKAAEPGTGAASQEGKPLPLVGNEALAYFLAVTYDFLVKAGIDPRRLRLRQHEPDEMAHYASDCWDAEFHSDRYGWVECVGVADRGCYDLSQHAVATGKPGDFQVAADLLEPVQVEVTRRVPVMGVLGKTFKQDAKAIAAALESQFTEDLHGALLEAGFPAGWLDDDLVIQAPKQTRPADSPHAVSTGDGQQFDVPLEGFELVEGTWRITGRKLIPRVIEPSFGVDRILYALWEHAYERGEKKGEPYTVMHLSPDVAPIQIAVLPLTTKNDLPLRAQAIERALRAAGLATDYDESGNIGRRYARQDEVGTPYCITIDDDTANDGAVTVRDRDTTEQKRVPVDDLVNHVHAAFRDR